PSRVQGWLLVVLGLLVAGLIGGIVFVLVSNDDSKGGGDSAGGDVTTTTARPTTTSAPATTAPPGASAQIVGEFADAIVNGSSGRFTHAQARCMAQGILQAIGLQRLAEVRIEASRGTKPNPVDLLTKEEQDRAFEAMRHCVPGGNLNQAPTS